MAINENTPITITLPVAGVNMVLGALSTQPYERVAGLIANIQQQAAPQVQEEAAPAEEPAAGGTD